MFQRQFKPFANFIVFIIVLRTKFVVTEENSICDYTDGCGHKYCDTFISFHTSTEPNQLNASVRFRVDSKSINFNKNWTIKLLYSKHITQFSVQSVYLYEESVPVRDNGTLIYLPINYTGLIDVFHKQIKDDEFELCGEWNDFYKNILPDIILITFTFQATYPEGKRFAELMKVIFNDKEICQGTYKCGLPSGSIEMINKGKIIQPGEFPWLAAIFNYYPLGKDFICGGSLISDQLVLTAAHCSVRNGYEASELLVQLGKHKLITIGTEHDVQTFMVAEIFIHPHYGMRVNGKRDADIAVYKLQGKAILNEFVRPVCLNFIELLKPSSVNTNGTVVGWGMNETGEADGYPKKVEIPIVSLNVCREDDGRFFNITSERTFCGGSKDGKGPCLGDSGGGFYSTFRLPGEKIMRYQIAGIISRSLTINRDGHTTCDLFQYSVYTNVYSFQHWLLIHIGVPAFLHLEHAFERIKVDEYLRFIRADYNPMVPWDKLDTI